jgi:hypothetical protein
VLLDVLGDENHEAYRTDRCIELPPTPSVGVILGVSRQDLHVGREFVLLVHLPQLVGVFGHRPSLARLRSEGRDIRRCHGRHETERCTGILRSPALRRSALVVAPDLHEEVVVGLAVEHSCSGNSTGLAKFASLVAADGPLVDLKEATETRSSSSGPNA